MLSLLMSGTETWKFLSDLKVNAWVLVEARTQPDFLDLPKVEPIMERVQFKQVVLAPTGAAAAAFLSFWHLYNGNWASPLFELINYFPTPNYFSVIKYLLLYHETYYCSLLARFLARL